MGINYLNVISIHKNACAGTLQSGKSRGRIEPFISIGQQTAEKIWMRNAHWKPNRPNSIQRNANMKIAMFRTSEISVLPALELKLAEEKFRSPHWSTVATCKQITVIGSAKFNFTDFIACGYSLQK